MMNVNLISEFNLAREQMHLNGCLKVTKRRFLLSCLHILQQLNVTN